MDCPASGQPALGLASGPGIGCPRKNQTRPLEHSKPLDNCSLNWPPEQDVAGGPSWQAGARPIPHGRLWLFHGADGDLQAILQLRGVGSPPAKCSVPTSTCQEEVSLGPLASCLVSPPTRGAYLTSQR